MVSDLKTFAHMNYFICSLRLNVFFPPFPKVQCQNFWNIKNPWGKSNEKKWSQIVRTFAHKGCKIAKQKKFFFYEVCLTSRVFWYWCYYPHRSRDALSPVCVIFFCNNKKSLSLYLYIYILGFILPCKSDFQPIFLKKQGIY